MTRGRGRDDRAAGGSRWAIALLRGFAVFVWVVGIGVAGAVTAFLVADPGVSFAGALRLGALYVGPFHHVPVVVRGAVAVDRTKLPGWELPASGSVTLEVGIALLGVTLLAAWMLFRAGRAVAGTDDRAVVRTLFGARVAIGYAVPMLVVGLVTFQEPLALGPSVSGQLRISLGTWEAFVFPFAIAAAAGAAGGLWSWAVSDGRRSLQGALAGGWSMLLLGSGLALAGLFVAGVVQPDEPVASATPTTARYFRGAFAAGPGPGALVLAHHLAITPNEAMWTLVPAAGGCDVARSEQQVDLVCYGRFPRTFDLPALVTRPNAHRRTAPAGYLLFLAVPALAAIGGGRRAARTSGARGIGTAAVGAGAGAVFAVLVGAGSVMSAVTISYRSSEGIARGGGSLWLGPDPVWATVLALVWGVVGGALGAWAFAPRVRAGRRSAGRSGRR